jgi:AraC-like DNA-binding protein
MDILERTVIIPENQSYIIREIELKNNKGVIHMHDTYELNYIVDAFGRRFVAGNISKFCPGDLIFMGPGVPHCWEIDNKEVNPKAVTIHFRKTFFEHVILNIPELSFLNHLINASRRGLFIKGIDQKLLLLHYKELIEMESNFENIVRILRLLKNIAHAEDIQQLEISEFNWSTDLPQNHRLKKIYEYVFYNFQKDIRLNEAASVIGLSEGAFCAFFKKSTKKTFLGFIKEVRIGYACKLLVSDTDKPISAVCFESGYNNFANFNRQFKEITGASPKEYRIKMSR